MIRRAKIKARPVLRKAQGSAPKPASQPSKPESETTATPDTIKKVAENTNSDEVATAESGLEVLTSGTKANIVEPPSEEIATANSGDEAQTSKTEADIIEPPQEDTSKTEALPTQSDSPQSTKVDIDNTKDLDSGQENPGPKTIITVRRRKLTACPTIGKNRRKPNSTKSATSSNTEENNSLPSTSDTIIEVSALPTPAEDSKSSEKKESCVNKTSVPGGRRRKVTACPTINTKRRKIDTHSAIAKPIVPTTVDTSESIDTSPNLSVSEIPSATVDTITLPTQEIGASEEVISDVAAVTTIDEARSDRTILDSPIYGIKSNDVSITTITTVTTLPDNENKKPGVSQHQQQKIILPKKTALVKVKTKSLSSNYRSKAMEKLNRLRKNQADSGAWPKWDQNFVSMSDLIFLNPPAESGQRLGMNANRDIPVVESVETPASSNQEVETQDETGEDAPMPVPQIRIAEDGSVVVDEESLVLDTQKPQNPEITTVYETGRDNMINQRSFVRRAPARGMRWTVDETNKFYKCLCVVGAEFSLMSAMFRGRTPDDLRRKFKREHKSNPDRVDLALMQQHLSKWTDDMFVSGDTSDAGVMKPAPETVSQS